MASISTGKDGNRRIFFSGADGKRRIVYLGGVPMKTARTIKAHVEELAGAAMAGHAPNADTSAWLGTRDCVLYEKLAAVGLVPSREPATAAERRVALGKWLDEYIEGRTDVKPRTRINFNQARSNLVRFFGAEKHLAEISPGDADNFRLDLMGRLSENTARRHCGRAKQFFRAAVRKRLISENPFADMKGCGVKANKSRFYFITRDEAYRVLEACPDAQWRLLFALSRFGGLRCPSEHVALRWCDVNWERNRITVRSPKTEHHEGGESRDIPIFPELRPYLEEVWEQAEPGTEYVITRYRDGNTNLRTQLERIIRQAGLKAWPKLFQNLRSTRETELAERHPIHVVCAWIGNSQAVATKHYLQVRDEDFDRAAAIGGDDAESDAQTERTMAQKTTLPMSAKARQTIQEKPKALENQGLRQALAAIGDVCPNYRVPPEGLEPSTS